MADLRGCRAARMSVVALKRTGLVASVKAAMDRTGIAQAVIPVDRRGRRTPVEG